MTTLSILPPALPFKGFRAAVYSAVVAKPGAFVPVPAAVERGSNVVKAAKKINLRLEDAASPFEVRVLGTAKAPSGVGLFVVGSTSLGRAPSDSTGGRKRTSFGDFGSRIAATLPLRAETAPVRIEARAEAAKTVAPELPPELPGEAETEAALPPVAAPASRRERRRNRAA